MGTNFCFVCILVPNPNKDGSGQANFLLSFNAILIIISKKVILNQNMYFKL